MTFVGFKKTMDAEDTAAFEKACANHERARRRVRTGFDRPGGRSAVFSKYRKVMKYRGAPGETFNARSGSQSARAIALAAPLCRIRTPACTRTHRYNSQEGGRGVGGTRERV